MTDEDIKAVADKINGIEDHVEAVKYWEQLLHRLTVSALVRVHEMCSRRLLAAIGSAEYLEHCQKENEAKWSAARWEESGN